MAVATWSLLGLDRYRGASGTQSPVVNAWRKLKHTVVVGVDLRERRFRCFLAQVCVQRFDVPRLDGSRAIDSKSIGLLSLRIM